MESDIIFLLLTWNFVKKQIFILVKNVFSITFKSTWISTFNENFTFSEMCHISIRSSTHKYIRNIPGIEVREIQLDNDIFIYKHHYWCSCSLKNLKEFSPFSAVNVHLLSYNKVLIQKPKITRCQFIRWLAHSWHVTLRRNTAQNIHPHT